MRVCAVLPYRPRDDDRPANLEVTRRSFDALGWPVYLGDHKGDPFCRGVAINEAAALAIEEHDPDALLVSDSDIYVPSQGQLAEAAETAHRHGCYAVAYSHCWVLDRDATLRVRAGASPSPRMPGVIEAIALVWGGVFAISRELWERTGGFDPAFRGYGSEDLGFLPVANTLGSPKQRVMGDSYHLMHPTNDERDDYAANARLASRYREVDGDRQAMEALLLQRQRELEVAT